MQYHAGTCTVTNNSNLVTANAPIAAQDWSWVVAGNLFTVSGSDVPYLISNVQQVTISGAQYWQLVLSSNYTGVTNTAASYTIHKDFTPLGIPLLRAGDTNTPTIFSRAMALIDSLFRLFYFSYAQLLWNTTNPLDFSAGNFQDIIATGNLNFATSANRKVGGRIELRINPGASNRNLAFNNNWVFVGGAIPTTIAANKIGTLTLRCFGVNETDVIASYQVQS